MAKAEGSGHATVDAWLTLGSIGWGVERVRLGCRISGVQRKPLRFAACNRSARERGERPKIRTHGQGDLVLLAAPGRAARSRRSK